ncbi:MAG: phage tail tape measure protein, partial [Phycisphaerales bacterium]
GLSRVEDASQRAAIAQQILGRSGSQLLPLMQTGAAGIEALQAQARSLGLTIRTQTAADAAKLTDEMNILRKVLRITSVTIGSALAPALGEILGRITRAAVAANEWVSQNREMVVIVAKVAGATVAAGAGLIGLGLAIKVVASSFGGLATLVSLAGGALSIVASIAAAMVSPVGLLAAGVGVLGVQFLRTGGRGAAVLEFLGDRFRLLHTIATSAMGGVRDAIAAGDLALAARVAWAGVRLAFLEGTREIRETVAEGMLTVRLVWTDTLSGMSRLWTRFAGGVRQIWTGVQSYLAKGFVDLMGLFDDSLDVDAVKRQIEDDSLRTMQRVLDQTQRSLQDIDSEQDARTRRILDNAVAGVEARSRALRDARDELEAALDEARTRRQDVETGAGAAAPRFDDRILDLIDDLDNIGQDIGRRIEVRSTFNPALISRLLGVDGSAAEDRTAQNTTKLVRLAERIEREVSTGAAVFA